MYQNFIKRAIDIILCVVILPIVAVIGIPIAMMIKISDGGSIFYKDKRYGKDMEIFDMYKFRSMIENAPDIRNSDGTTYNSENDPRVTKMGKFLRKTSLDELPQFINVLLGDMSIIGPRPSPMGDKSMYPKEFFDKFKVKPGISGYSQAKVRNNATMEERIKLDKYYVENMSFFLDLKIILMTILTVIFKKNINRN